MTDTTTAAGAAEDGDVLAGVYETTAADPTVRPQDDLFRHVNGAWLRTAEIPADRPGFGSFVLLRDAAEAACREILEEAAADWSVSGSADAPTTPSDKIGALYASFIDEEAVEALGASPLEPELAPLLGASTKEELARAIGAGVPAGFTGLFGVDVEVDLNDPERYTTWFGQDGLGLPDESYYREESQKDLREAYVAHVARMLSLAGLDERLGAQAQDLAERVMALETRIAKGHWDRVACRDIERMNNPTTWAELAASGEAFPWEAWRGGIAAAAEAAGTGLRGFLDEAIVEQPDYVGHAAGVWADADLEDLRAWALWHTVHGRATLLSSDFVTANFDFYSKRLQGVDGLRARWKRGVGLIEGTLGEALGELYVARHFPPSYKAEMERLVADLIEAYRGSISSLSWMGPATRERALEKLSQFTPKIGYPDTWRDYADVVVTPGDVIASVRSVELFELARSLRKLGSPVDRAEWHMTPQTVNAYYNPTMNEVVFPAAILQPPFFDPEADAAVNYAGIGAVIGHEIGHGFDDQGAKYDGDGNLVDWWTDDDRTEFGKRTKALIEQYNAFEPKALPGHPVNGEFTIGENIGDLGGLSIALAAYRISLADSEPDVLDELTGLQRVFFGWAQVWRTKARDEEALRRLAVDPHSPPEFRCNGVVRNVDAFYEAFDIQPGDALYLEPEARVRIW